MKKKILKNKSASNGQLIRLVDQWKPKRILVAGDFMLDRYVYGNADRLSPDAPVPVLAAVHEEYKPGGAANVCLDLAALQCHVTCLGIVGRDEHGKKLIQTIKDTGCKTQGLILSADRPTTLKQNFIGLAQHRHPQKMFRVDIEDKTPLADKTIARLLKAAEKIMPRCDVLCLEDYNKGVLTPKCCQLLIELAQKHHVPILVDPAAIEDYSRYRGATCMTPNRTEAVKATGMPADNAKAMGKKIMRDLDLKTIVITLDKQGALLLRQGHQPLLIPTQARSVYDVTGAGDMVLAMLAASLANGIDWPQAVQLANAAAGLEVERFGVVPIALHEILLSLLEQQHAELGKVRTLDQLLPELDAYRQEGRKIVFTNGCFDILHAGHVAYLRQARAKGDLLVVGVNSDQSISRIKGPDRPVNHQDDRLMVLSELESIDYLIVFDDDDTPRKLLKAIRPDVLAKGGDYSRDQVVGAEIVESYGGRVDVVNLVRGRSTTNIIRKIETTKRR